MVAQIDRVYARFGPFKILKRFFCYLLEGRPLTTRGRSVNFLIRKILELSPRFNVPGVRKPIYILGMGRSGTTFLGNVLSVHKSVAYLNEPKLMWSIAFPADDIVGNYTAQPAKYRMTDMDFTESGSRVIRAAYGLCLAVCCSERIVDKYPEMIFRASLIRKIFPDARLVAIIRKGSCVIRSVSSWNDKNRLSADDGLESWWGLNDKKWNILCDELVVGHEVLSVHYEEIRAFSLDTCRSAVEWMLTMDEILKTKDMLGDELMVVKYEDLINDSAVLQKIVEHCELPDDPDVVRYFQDSKLASEEKPYESEVLPECIRSYFELMLCRLGYGN